MTETTTKQIAVSPDKKYVAIAQVYDGGATTDYAPMVYIRHNPNYKEWWYPESETEKVFSAYHTDEIGVRWISENELEIYCKCRADYMVGRYWGIDITHKAISLNKALQSTQKTRD